MSKAYIGIRWVKIMEESQYFEKISEYMWTEYQNGKKFADFTEISFQYPEVILEKDQNTSVRLTENIGYLKNDLYEIYFNYFTQGRWENVPESKIQEDQITSEITIKRNGGSQIGIKWIKSMQESQYFEKISENKWSEYHNGEKIVEFIEFLFLYPEAVLKKTDGAFIRLTESSGFTGQSINGITNLFSNGKWESSLQQVSSQASNYLTQNQSDNNNVKEDEESFSNVLRLVNDLKFTNALEKSIQGLSSNPGNSKLKKAKSNLVKLNESQRKYQQLIADGNKLLFRKDNNQARKKFKQALDVYIAITQDSEILSFFNLTDLNLIDYIRKGKKKFEEMIALVNENLDNEQNNTDQKDNLNDSEMARKIMLIMLTLKL